MTSKDGLSKQWMVPLRQNREDFLPETKRHRNCHILDFIILIKLRQGISNKSQKGHALVYVNMKIF